MNYLFIIYFDMCMGMNMLANMKFWMASLFDCYLVYWISKNCKNCFYMIIVFTVIVIYLLNYINLM
jgi:hypothetical protein